MRLLLVVLAAAASTAAQAQVHRCEDGQGNTSYQQTACATLAPAPAPGDSGTAGRPPEGVSPTDAEIGHPSARRERAQQEAVAIAARVRQRQEQPDQRDALRHAENRERCVEALRVAELCGKHAGTFYCDAHGFRPIAVAARAKDVGSGHGHPWQVERCAVDAKAARN